ncbi:hypothetical protein BMR1_03g04181 [Babesia microti strain RI]|uniref:Uncharacterized protein n=1 Tax=Babesia microti (strain RI) TaxID=1133968 RepID=A0A1R4ACB8_BABMR|nr:hypothetical protein BMR1_03g04181 [Babesia microti strain RI]SJK86646.1 hypothetical protein BMR1_03g04181 [Babesia microti strain RI]|eukprot:XP_021338778.1 hypothetical protein BMR1_03g04181 [Babesia microti strain RI]
MNFFHNILLASLIYHSQVLSTHTKTPHNTEDIYDGDLGRLKYFIKETALAFVDCAFDISYKYCDYDTLINFECFRNLGKCIPKALESFENSSSSDQSDNFTDANSESENKRADEEL